MELLAVLLCLIGLQAKHFVADFCTQTPRMLAEKGTYGAVGGLQHAGIHGGLSFLVLLLLSPLGWMSLVAAGVEAVVHYHIDWIKERLTPSGLGPTSQSFWILLGADQLAHQMTLIAMVWWIFA